MVTARSARRFEGVGILAAHARLREGRCGAHEPSGGAARVDNPPFFSLKARNAARSPPEYAGTVARFRLARRQCLPMSRIQCGQVRFEAANYFADPQRYARVLARAHEAREHILCECVQPPRRLVVRYIHGQFWLAVWPQDRESHAPDCAIRRHGEGVSPGELGGAVPPPWPPVTTAAELLAALPKSPRAWWWHGPPALQDCLRDIPASATWKDRPVGALLLVCPPQGDWAHSDGRLVLARLRSVESSRFGWRLWLQGLDDPVYVSRERSPADLAATCDALTAPCATGAAEADPVGARGVVTLLEVYRTRSGNLSAVDGAIAREADASASMVCGASGAGAAVSATIASGRGAEAPDAALAERLVRDCRLHIPGGTWRERSAGQSASAGAQSRTTQGPVDPAFVLLDAPQPTGLFIAPARMSAPARAALQRSLYDWAAQGRGVWLWDCGRVDAMPALPAPSAAHAGARHFDGGCGRQLPRPIDKRPQSPP